MTVVLDLVRARGRRRLTARCRACGVSAGGPRGLPVVAWLRDHVDAAHPGRAGEFRRALLAAADTPTMPEALTITLRDAADAPPAAPDADFAALMARMWGAGHGGGAEDACGGPSGPSDGAPGPADAPGAGPRVEPS